jgi:hypothetical protein
MGEGGTNAILFKMPSLLFPLLTSLAVPAVAWLPGEHRDIYAHDGANLFNASAVPSAGSDKRWLSESGKIRGVNMGSLFVIEPWMVPDEWEKMGCGNAASEWDCVSALGQSQANTVFQSHWGSWITQSDISEMQSYGLNTIRIPVGYWMDESLVYADSEHFPQGGLHYLSQLCGWASDAGFYIIIDMHGAPGAQVAANEDTGQVIPLGFESPCGLADIMQSSMHQALVFMSTPSMTAEPNFWDGWPTKSTRTIT